MSPSAVEAAVHTNGQPSPSYSTVSPNKTSELWTPQTVISTISEPPRPNSTSPLPFLHLLERLKTNKREGWRRFGLDRAESIADHMYRMSIITMLCPSSLASQLNIPKCMKMALVHDMAESLVGDITPVDGVTKIEKSRREAATMDYLCRDMLGNFDGGVSGQDLRAIWQEYEDAETMESKFVHDVDKMELLLQMVEYERSSNGRKDLGEFSHVARRILLPEVQVWAQESIAERNAFWNSLGRIPKTTELTEERKRQVDEYYGAATNGSTAVNGGTRP